MKKHAAKAVHTEASASPLPERQPFGQEDSDEAEFQPDNDDDEELIIDEDMTEAHDAAQPMDGDDDKLQFAPISASALAASHASVDQRIKSQLRKVPIPPHRMSPLKRDWPCLLYTSDAADE